MMRQLDKSKINMAYVWMLRKGRNVEVKFICGLATRTIKINSGCTTTVLVRLKVNMAYV